LFQLVLVVGDYHVWHSIGLILQRHYFQSESGGRDVDVGGLFVVIGIALIFQLSAGINRKPGIMHIGSFAYVDPSKRSIDVHVLVLVVIVVLFHIDAASSE